MVVEVLKALVAFCKEKGLHLVMDELYAASLFALKPKIPFQRYYYHRDESDDTALQHIPCPCGI